MNEQDDTHKCHKSHPIFVVGFPRSGTTLLATMLDRHSQVAVPPETSFFLRHFQRELRQSAHSGKLLPRGYIRSMIQNLGLNPDKVWLQFNQAQPCNDTELLKIILEEYTQARDKSRTAEKSPFHLHAVPRIMESFPDSRVICIVRDGRDAVVSWSNTPFGRTMNLRFMCLEWNRAVRQSCSYSKQYKNFLSIRYEDLLHHPAAVLTRVCDFLGIAFEPQQLLSESPSNTFDTTREPWKKNATKKIDVSRAFAWKHQLTPAQQAALTNLMRRSLVRLEYDTSMLSESSFDSRIRRYCDSVYAHLLHLAIRVKRRVV